MSVARAQSEIDSREFGEWLAYDNITPIGDDRADYVAAIGTSALVNAWGDKTVPRDFMPFLPDDSKPQSVEEQQAILKGAVQEWRQSQR